MLDRLKRPEGAYKRRKRRKITQYTRYLTVAIALIQSSATSIWLERMEWQGILVVPVPGIGFKLLTTLVMTTGALFVMWLGEQITEREIGNGASIMIFANIVASFPQGLAITIEQLLYGEMNKQKEVNSLYNFKYSILPKFLEYM